MGKMGRAVIFFLFFGCCRYPEVVRDVTALTSHHSKMEFLRGRNGNEITWCRAFVGLPEM